METEIGNNTECYSTRHCITGCMEMENVVVEHKLGVYHFHNQIICLLSTFFHNNITIWIFFKLMVVPGRVAAVLSLPSDLPAGCPDSSADFQRYAAAEL
jgi:hypothetical protein